MSEMSVKMTLSLVDGATRPLQEFIDKLKSMDASLKGSTTNLSEIGKMMAGLKISPSTVESMNNFTASLRRAAETSPLIKSLATELNALSAAMQSVKSSSNGIGNTLTTIGNRAGGASIQTSKLAETLAALDAALNASKAKIEGAAAAFGTLNTEARAAGAGVMVGTRNIALAGDEVAATTAKVDGLGASLKAMAGLWAAFKIEKGLVSSAGAAAEFQVEEAKLKMLNMPKGDAESISKKAWSDSEKYKFVSPVDALKYRQATMEAMALQQDSPIIDNVVKSVMVATNVLKTIGVEGDPKNITKNLLALSEVRGNMSNPEKIKHDMDLVLKASLATGGKITPSDIDVMMRNYGSGASTASDDAIMKMIAVADMYKTAGGSGGGGGGGSGVSTVGVAFKMMRAYLMGKPMNKQGAGILQEVGIFGPDAEIPGSTTTSANIREGAAKNAKMTDQDVIRTLQQHLPQIMAYTERYRKEYYSGKSNSEITQEDRDAALQKFIIALGVSVSAAKAVAISLSPRLSQRTDEMVANMKRADSADAAQKKLDETQAQQLRNFNAELDKLKIAIGQSVLPQLTKLITSINDLIASVAKFSKDHEFVTAVMAWGAAIGSVALAVTSFAKLFGASFGGIGKTITSTASKAIDFGKTFATVFSDIASSASTMASRIAAYLAPIGATLSSIVGGIGMLLYSNDAGAAPMPGGEMGAEIAAEMRRKGKMQMPVQKLGIKSIFSRYGNKPHEPVFTESSTEGMNTPAAGKGGHKSTFDQQLSDLKQGNILIEDEIKRHQRELARQFTAQRIGIREYYAKDLEDAQKLLKSEIILLQEEQRRQEQIGDKRGAAATGTQITLKRRDLAELPLASEAKQREAMDALKKEQESVNSEYTKLSGESDTAGAIAAAQSAGDKTAAMFRLNKMDDAAQKADNLTKLKIAHIQFADAMQKVTDITEARDRAEKQLNYDVAAGTITALDAANKQTEIKKQWARDIQNPLDTAAQYAMTSADKKTVQQQAQEGKAALDSLNASAQQVKNSMQGAFANFFDGLVSGTKNVRQLFKGLFDQIAQSITNMISQNMANSLMNSLFGIQPGGGQGGQSTGILANLLGGLFGGGSSGATSGTAAGAAGSSAGGGSGFVAGLGSIFGSMASFAVGTDYVPQDMIAMIHKGEKITPAAYNTPKYNAQSGVTQHLNFNFSQPQSTETMLQMAGVMNNAMRQAQRNM